MLEPAKQAVNDRFAVFFVDGPGEGNAHRASLDAVLRVAAVGNAVCSHDAFKAIPTRHLSRRMHVE